MFAAELSQAGGREGYVRQRTDLAAALGEIVRMKTHTRTSTPIRRRLLGAGLLSLTFSFFAAAWQPVGAQPSGSFAGARLYADGLAHEHRKDDLGAFDAFSRAAENDYPPAQRKLGDIYGHGNRAVVRDYEQSLHWYEKARDNGEYIPPIESRMPGLDAGPR